MAQAVIANDQLLKRANNPAKDPDASVAEGAAKTDQGSRRQGTEKYKIQIQLSEKAKDRLFELVDRTEAESAAQVVREALRIYDVLIEEMSNVDSKLLLHRGDEDRTVELRLF